MGRGSRRTLVRLARLRGRRPQLAIVDRRDRPRGLHSRHWSCSARSRLARATATAHRSPRWVEPSNDAFGCWLPSGSLLTIVTARSGSTSPRSPVCTSRCSRRPSSRPALRPRSGRSIGQRFRTWCFQSRARPGMSGAVSEWCFRSRARPVWIVRSVAPGERWWSAFYSAGMAAVPAGLVPVAPQVRRIGGNGDVVAGADGDLVMTARTDVRLAGLVWLYPSNLDAPKPPSHNPFTLAHRSGEQRPRQQPDDGEHSGQRSIT